MISSTARYCCRNTHTACSKPIVRSEKPLRPCRVHLVVEREADVQPQQHERRVHAQSSPTGRQPAQREIAHVFEGPARVEEADASEVEGAEPLEILNMGKRSSVLKTRSALPPAKAPCSSSESSVSPFGSIGLRASSEYPVRCCRRLRRSGRLRPVAGRTPVASPTLAAAPNTTGPALRKSRC